MLDATQPIAMENEIDNLRLAYERTALAWVRTALALIGFGFTIDKLFEALPRSAEARHVQPQTVGITMIAFGLCALVLFLIQLRQFRKAHPQIPRSNAGFLAALIAILGVMALVSAIVG